MDGGGGGARSAHPRVEPLRTRARRGRLREPRLRGARPARQILRVPLRRAVGLDFRARDSVGAPFAHHPGVEPRFAYGYGEPGTKSYDLLVATGGLWGDAHHPALSETGGDFDGRWLFINDKAHGRLGKIDLKTFETVAITKIPNLQGAHGIAVVSPDTRYVYVDGELEVPIRTASPRPRTTTR